MSPEESFLNSMKVESSFEVPDTDGFRFVCKKAMSKYIDFLGIPSENKTIFKNTINFFWNFEEVDSIRVSSDHGVRAHFWYRQSSGEEILEFNITNGECTVHLKWCTTREMDIKITHDFYLKGVELLNMLSTGAFDWEKLGGDTDEYGE